MLMIISVSFLVFSLWIQPGDSKHYNHKTSLYTSPCKDNQTSGTQHTEGNVSAVTDGIICK